MAKKIIYADNAATTKMSPAATDTMIRFLSTDYGNASQPYSFSRSSKMALKEARSIISDCIGAKAEEIFFTSGGSESDNWVISNAYELNKSIITTEIEHQAILQSCNHAESKGCNVVYLPVDRNGCVSPQELETVLKPNCILSIMMANNEIGTIETISQYGAIAKSNDAIFHTDAVQAMGHVDVNVKDLGVDMLSASGHKFNGPKGVGFLYVREGISISPLIFGGGQEFGLRAGTENVASIMAMAIALRENVENLEKNKQHLYRLENALLEKLSSKCKKFVRNGKNQMPGLLSLSFEGLNGESILHRLDLKGICVSTGSACNSKQNQISHVLKAINLPLEFATGTIRISLGKYNTLEDVNCIAETLSIIVNQ